MRNANLVKRLKNKTQRSCLLSPKWLHCYYMSTPSIESIKSWAEEDRPREKMLLKGRASLSDAELIAIILGSGSRDESAVSLAKRVLASVDHNLHELGKLSLVDMMKFKGIGEAKAISIAAAVEIGRRRSITTPKKKPIITTSAEAYDIIQSTISDMAHEEMWIILLNRGNRLIKKMKMSSGGSTATIVDVKMILKAVIDAQAQSIILVHNHPSGSLSPSRADIEITHKIKEAAKFFDLTVMDHIIVAETGYYSFVDDGRM